jgi:GTP pyrophosphokinase
MMRQYELVERVKAYNPKADEGLLNRAYVYAMKAHGTQKRASGAPFISHPLEVAAILTELRLDDSTIAAALLHDTIEDTSATRAEIDAIFGPDIGHLVEGLTKILKLDLVSKKAAQAENLRKLLLAIADDVRVLLIKLADRLHNMRTLDFVPEAKRARIAEETLDIYAPLAGRMGMQDLREELEDLAFRHFMPEAYAAVSIRLEELSRNSGPVISIIETELSQKFHAAGLKADVSGRLKKPYSVWKKMERKSVSFEQLSDILGFRVLVDKVSDCYAVLGLIHTTWSTVPGRFKDYISTPKQNDYRSIHTTIIGPSRQRVELQIRTFSMNDIAEFGIAAHTLYKDGDGAPNSVRAQESRAYAGLRKMVESLADGDSAEEFLEHTKLELFHDQVFCFTPKGRLIALPRRATPIDFAYAVHTDVGDGAVGCKVNGRLVPLVSELNNGDEVEIIRAEGQTPPAAWESMVITGKARAAIRRATRTAVRRQYAGLGKTILERAFVRAEKSYDEDRLKAALPRLGRASFEDILAGVGRGEIFSGDVVKAVYPDFKHEQAAGAGANLAEGGWFAMRKAQGLVFKVPGSGEGEPGETDVGSIPIRGIGGDLPVKFAPNGGAVPGDRIVGILTPGEGITIYPIQSPALTAFDDQPERWLDVRWDIEDSVPQRFPAQLAVTAMNEPGSLATVAAIIGESDGNIDSISMTGKSADFREMLINVEVWDLKHLSAIIGQLRTKPVISAVSRVNG